jgi:hypothetical protein
MDSLEPELLPDCNDFVTEECEVPVDVVGTVRGPAAELVVDRDCAFVGEPLGGAK